MYRVDYSKYRSRLLPIIKRVARQNKDDFAGDADQALLNGRAFLFIVREGFVVLQPMSGNRVLVLFAFSFGGGDAMAKYDDEIASLAKKINATKLVFQSTRKGFRRLAKRFGYHIQSRFGNRYIYAKEI